MPQIRAVALFINILLAIPVSADKPQSCSSGTCPQPGAEEVLLQRTHEVSLGHTLSGMQMQVPAEDVQADCHSVGNWGDAKCALKCGDASSCHSKCEKKCTSCACNANYVSTLAPTPDPTQAPTAEPTAAPTAAPTTAPTLEPTAAPTPQFLSLVFTCDKTQTHTSGKSDDLYKAIAQSIFHAYAAKPSTMDRQDYAACLVRTAGHDLMDFRFYSDGTASGGSDGCINFAEEDNMGILACLTKNEVEVTYEEFCDRVSLGDFLVIAAEAAMSRAATMYNSPSTSKLWIGDQNTYAIGDENKDTCPAGFEAVTTKEGCELAAEAVGYKFMETSTSSKRPGCYRQASRTRWNKHATGDPTKTWGTHQICVETVAATTTTSTTPGYEFIDGSLERAFMEKFVFGRPSNPECHDVGLMPNPEEGCADLKRIFVDHLFLNADKKVSWKHTAAISGVHTLGGAHPEISGYNGTWTSDPSVFNNAYYKRIIDQGWGPQTEIGGNPNKNQWIVSDLSRFNPGVDTQMMLNSDMCLIFDNSVDSVGCDDNILSTAEFYQQDSERMNYGYQFCKNIRGRGHFLNAKERMCCTWTRADKMFTDDAWHQSTGDMTDPLPAFYTEGAVNEHCGKTFTSKTENLNSEMRKACCDLVMNDPASEGKNSMNDCTYQGNLEGPAWESMLDFAYDETVWLAALVEAWDLATTNSINYLGKDNAELVAEGKDTCTSCQNPYKDPFVEGEEGYVESQFLSAEDTYDKSFWENRKPTWPYGSERVAEWGPDLTQRIHEKFAAYLEERGQPSDWVYTMVTPVR